MMRGLWLIPIVLFANCAQAELVALEDSELSAVQGAGIGFALEGILFDASQATITINDITNGSGQNVPISVKEFYLGATGSNKGASLSPVNIGRLSSPSPSTLQRARTCAACVAMEPTCKPLRATYLCWSLPSRP